MNLEHALEAHENKNTSDHMEMWKSIDGVRNRLPVWALLLISTLTALLGAAVACIALRGGSGHERALAIKDNLTRGSAVTSVSR